MKNFDFFEFVAVVAPGTVTLVGALVLLSPADRANLLPSLSLGGAAVFSVLAYVAGHMIQALGNLVESVWWSASGGWPTDWVRTGKPSLLSADQLTRLERVLRDCSVLPRGTPLSKVDPTEWRYTPRECFAILDQRGKTGRIERFNANYNLFRGLAASFLVLLVAHAATGKGISLRILTGLAIALFVALSRMNRFGVNYARELFVQLLSLGASGGPSDAPG